jgi:hypothetical protein
MNILSLDISTTKIGIAVLNKDKQLLLTDVFFLSSEDSLFARVRKFSDYFEGILKFDIDKIAIEEPFIMTSSGGSAQVTAMLLKFNGMVSMYLHYQFGIVPTYINPMTARSKLGIKIPRGLKTKQKKQLLIDYVATNYPKEFVYEKTKKDNYVIGTDDKADAIIVGLAYLEINK